MSSWTKTARLIKLKESGLDEDGFRLDPSETTTEVSCNIMSVKRSEFYEAQRAGRNVVKTVELNTWDYDGQELCEIDGESDESGNPVRYRIYRVYDKPETETTELTLAEDGDGRP